MIALYIIGGLLLLVIAILLLPVSVYTEYKEDLVYKIKLAGITVFNSLKVKKKPDKEPEPPPSGDTPKKKENIFKKLQKEKGFKEAVREILGFVKDCLLRLKKLLRHIYIKKVYLNITVASGDAAQTAIEYGAVCSAVYPTLSLLEDLGNVKFKQININSDFLAEKPSFEFSANISVRIIFLISAMFGIFSEYKKFNARMIEDERK